MQNRSQYNVTAPLWSTTTLFISPDLFVFNKLFKKHEGELLKPPAALSLNGRDGRVHRGQHRQAMVLLLELENSLPIMSSSNATDEKEPNDWIHCREKKGRDGTNLGKIRAQGERFPNKSGTKHPKSMIIRLPLWFDTHLNSSPASSRWSINHLSWICSACESSFMPPTSPSNLMMTPA